MCVCIIGEERKASMCEFVYTCKKGMKEGGKEGKKKKGREKEGRSKEGRTDGRNEGRKSGYSDQHLYFFLCTL